MEGRASGHDFCPRGGQSCYPLQASLQIPFCLSGLLKAGERLAPGLLLACSLSSPGFILRGNPLAPYFGSGPGRMRPHDIWCRVVLCRGRREFCGRVLSAFACARVSPCARELHASPRIVLVVPVSVLDVAVRIVVVVVVVVQILLLPCVPLSSTALMLSPLGGRSAGGSTPATYSPMPW